MRIGEAKLSWVVCHCATRSVLRARVQCPMRGLVDCATCLGCRFLTTSSVERELGPWCDAWPMPRPVTRPMPVRVALPIPVEPPPPPAEAPPPVPADWPLRLPVLVARPAVRPPTPVPSGQLIGT
jgi:hypothetical protein